ncbi:hypothetical protein SAMN04515672_4091 [Natronorubrum texcoconense]|uniref:Glycine zipper-like domain-containing protein n=2 Tax=Natronorubrum texcoconense TaxID=1095776 RepID=A0A1G9F4X1_9EURY|nr:hypothetical protein SAMN04515672_4091 [Natronorubrum texcoconense]
MTAPTIKRLEPAKSASDDGTRFSGRSVHSSANANPGDSYHPGTLSSDMADPAAPGSESDDSNGLDETGFGAGIAIGMAIGVSIGIATDNLALWLPIGVAIGVALGAGMSE